MIQFWGLTEIRHVNHVHGKCITCDRVLRWFSSRDTSDDDGGDHEEKSFSTLCRTQSPLSLIHSVQFSSVTQLCPILVPYEWQHARPPCPSPTPGVHPNPRPLSW